MRSVMLMLLLLSCVMALPGCAGSGAVAKADCPQPDPPPPSLMVTPSFESKARSILLESDAPPTTRSEGSRPR